MTQMLQVSKNSNIKKKLKQVNIHVSIGDLPLEKCRSIMWLHTIP